MLSYQRLKHHPRALRAFTGLDQAEFEKLLTPFAMAYHAYRYDQHVTKKSRKRRYGGGRKPHLAVMEDKLLFILFYFKVYTLQEVIAFLFDTSQGRVNEWIHTLIPNLTNICAPFNNLPALCLVPWSRMHKYLRELVSASS